jgi:hypothetical protein
MDARNVTELRAMAEQLVESWPKPEDAAYRDWWESAAQTLLAASGENADLLREAAGWPRPEGDDPFRTRAESVLLYTADIAEHWAVPVDALALELARVCVIGMAPSPRQNYRHHRELVSRARDVLESEHQRELEEHPHWVEPLADARRALEAFAREATRQTLRAVQ